LGVAALQGAIIGGTTSFVLSLPAINGTDDLGFGGIGSAGDGTFLLETTGADGSARHVIQLQTLVASDEGQCGAPIAPPQAVPTPEVRTGRIYTPLEGALSAVSQVSVEPGNPAGLTPAQVEDIRSTLRSATIGMAKLFAAAEIEDARRLQDVERAIADYIVAKQMVEQSDPAGALRFFRSAFQNAAAVTAKKSPGADQPLPFHVALGTDFYSTKPRRRLEVPALILGSSAPPVLGSSAPPVLGASALPLLAVAGAPPGLNVEVVREPGTDAAFRLRFDIGQVAPGRYTLRIQASDGRNSFVHPFTLVVNAATQVDEPRIAALVNAASLRRGAVAPSSYVSLFGSRLSSTTTAAEQPAQSLGGTTVTVQDSSGVARSGGLIFGSPAQFNFVVPSGTAPGPAIVTLRRQDGLSHRALLEIEDTAPGLFSANGDGRGVAAAVVVSVRSDGSQVSQLAFTRGPDSRQVPLPIDIGEDPVYLLLFGTGIRGIRDLAAVDLRAGGINVPVLFAGPQGSFEGLDQVNAGPLPSILRGRGELELMLTVGGKPANIVTIAVR
jgi:uncharacterized protein (TIGR03437 family)